MYLLQTNCVEKRLPECSESKERKQPVSFIQVKECKSWAHDSNDETLLNDENDSD